MVSNESDPEAVGATEEDVLERVVHVVVETLGASGDPVDPIAVQVDADLFSGPQSLVVGHDLDSIHLLEVAVAFEDLFGISLTEDAGLPDPLSLRTLARYILEFRWPRDD